MKYIYVLAALIQIPISYYAGAISTSFESTHCYSQVITEMSTQSIEAIDSKDSSTANHYRQMVKTIPNIGYESNCTDILKHVKKAR